LIGSIYEASAESGDDSIYNIYRPTTKKILHFIFQEEKHNSIFCFILVIFTRVVYDGRSFISRMINVHFQKANKKMKENKKKSLGFLQGEKKCEPLK